MVRAADVRAWFGPAEVAMEWHGTRVRLSFLGAQPAPAIEGRQAAEARANFLLGPSEATWLTSVPVFRSIAYRDLYPGIDMVYSGSERHLKSEFIVAPGADPACVRLRYDGLGAPGVNADGALTFGGPTSEFREEAPEVYQEIGSHRVRVESKYRVMGDGSVGFELGAYDRTLPLVIDPTLAFSTYVGGTAFDSISAVAVDPTGNAYVAGWTESTDFPASGGKQARTGGGVDAFVAKFSATGTLLYATYLGGSGEDRATGIAVDASGNATITGWTYSRNFPVLSPVQPGLGGARDAFVTRLNASGSGFVYSTWLGGAGNDSGRGIALDTQGNAFVTGDTLSANFPVVRALQPVYYGSDAFLAKLSATGQLLFCTYLGGIGEDQGMAVAVDASGNPHVTGSTNSVDFPVMNALQRRLAGGQDAFVTKIAAGGEKLIYSTYVGGTGGTAGFPETGGGIAVDSQGNTYVTGTTSSQDFPVAAALRSTPGGGGLDAFVFKLNPTGSAFVYSTYLGGSSIDYGNALALDAVGNAYITGYTASQDFPVAEPYQRANAGLYDAYLAVLTPDGRLKSATYLGGTGSDTGSGVAVGGSGRVFVAGQTLSTDFPLASASQPHNYGAFGGFLTALQFGTAPSVVSVNPLSGSGLTQTFSFTVADPNGANDIAWIHIILNSTLSTTNACYLSYNTAQKLLYISQESSAATLAVTPIGGGASIENSYCRVNAAASSAAVSGSMLVLNVSITFKAIFAGRKDVFVDVFDTGNLESGWRAWGSWTVPGGNQRPGTASVTPSSGVGLSQIFSFTFSDPDGAADLAWTHVVIGPSVRSAGVCYFAYNRQDNILLLANDAGSGFTSMAPGTIGFLQNSQCALYLADSSAVSAGNILTLRVLIMFARTYAGAKNVYLFASDRAGTESGWLTPGTWTISGGTHPPSSQSVAPSGGAGAIQTFSFVFSDPDGSGQVVWAQGLINNAVQAINGCYFAYNPFYKLLILENDASTASIGAPIGSNAILENSQCSIALATSSAVTNGSILTVNVTVAFKAAFRGTKNVYAYALDIDGRESGWQLRGSWTGVP